MHGDDDESEEVCIICQDAILKQPVAALGCGHVYHQKCIDSWLAQCKGAWKSCPQCKKTVSNKQLRLLSYEVVTVLPQRSEEVLRDLSASADTRHDTTQQLQELWRTVRREFRDALARVRDSLEQGDSCKAQRRRLQESGQELEAMQAQMEKERDEARIKCAEAQAHLDKETERLKAQLPIAEVREEDPDFQEERRKARQGNVVERAKETHKSLLSAKLQKEEAAMLARKRIEAADETEQEAQLLRLEVERLRQELKQHRKAQKDSQAQSQISGDDVSLDALKRAYRERKPPSKVKASVVQGTKAKALQPQIGPGTLVAPVKRACADDEMLKFAGPSKLRRTTSAHLALGGGW